MAKKTNAKKTNPIPAVPQASNKAAPQISNEFELVNYETLSTARVRVQDKDGNLFYLEPGHMLGEFVLRVVPRTTTETVEPLPAEWKKPTPEEVKAASGKIDWEVPAEVVPEEGEE